MYLRKVRLPHFQEKNVACCLPQCWLSCVFPCAQNALRNTVFTILFCLTAALSARGGQRLITLTRSYTADCIVVAMSFNGTTVKTLQTTPGRSIIRILKSWVSTSSSICPEVCLKAAAAFSGIHWGVGPRGRFAKVHNQLWIEKLNITGENSNHDQIGYAKILYYVGFRVYDWS